jgi:hypothetical protein
MVLPPLTLTSQMTPSCWGNLTMRAWQDLQQYLGPSMGHVIIRPPLTSGAGQGAISYLFSSGTSWLRGNRTSQVSC